MTKEETDLIGEAIDFYNLNHFKGGKTKKQLVKLKKRIKALTIPVVIQQRELYCFGCEIEMPTKVDNKSVLRCGKCGLRH
tara:strand:- start:71437 stop:71676 length:240 start_codon:yes stop_codon:yes gene_type:complete